MMRVSFAILLLSTGAAAAGFQDVALRGLRNVNGLEGSLRNFQDALLSEKGEVSFAKRLEEATRQKYLPSVDFAKQHDAIAEAILHLTEMKEKNHDMGAVGTHLQSAVGSLHRLMIESEDNGHRMYRHRRASAVKPMTVEDLQKSVMSLTAAYEAGNPDAFAAETGILLQNLEPILSDLHDKINSLDRDEMGIRMRNAENEAPDLAASAYVAIKMLSNVADEAYLAEINEKYGQADSDVSAMQGQQLFILAAIGISIAATALWISYINSDDDDDDDDDDE